ncbi:MAG: hypothetical protein IKY90_07140 [Oscillospiraceae bacterium]|nr:hypothetical protein [Oscillospiraceae bacterium]
MKLTTSKGNEYTVDWIDGTTIISGEVILQMNDPRGLGVIASEFDGLEWLKREDEDQGNKEFVGFNVLKNISRMNNNKVQIALSKEE